MNFLSCCREKNDVTPSNAVKKNIDVSKVSKSRLNGAI